MNQGVLFYAKLLDYMNDFAFHINTSWVVLLWHSDEKWDLTIKLLKIVKSGRLASHLGHLILEDLESPMCILSVCLLCTNMW